MNKTTLAPQAKTAGLMPPSQGILQRKCACGSHAMTGGECEECAKKKGMLQRKLTIGASNDPLEQEADRVANQMMAKPAQSSVSGAPLRIQHYAGQSTESMEEVMPARVDRFLANFLRPLEPELGESMGERFGHDFSQMKMHSSGEEVEQYGIPLEQRDDKKGFYPVILQRHPTNVSKLGPTKEKINVDTSGGIQVPQKIRERAEIVFDTDFSSVRFHIDQNANNSAAFFQARAFTTGKDIYFGAGQYQTNTIDGLNLIGHELTHVVQQRQGLSQSKLHGVGDEYEQEANLAGQAFAQGKPIKIASKSGSLQGVQRSADPGADAQIDAVDDSPYGFPFLGSAGSESELIALLSELSSLEGGQPLGLVSEDFAINGGGDDSKVSETTYAEDMTLQAYPLEKPIQRAVVAGCNVPGVPPNIIGIAAHRQIGADCSVNAFGCQGGGHPGFQIPGAGRPDLVRQRPVFIDELGEIKPATWLGRGLQSVAAAQLAGDLVAYTAAIGPAVPMWSYSFSGAPFILNPTQALRAWGPSGGIYYYSCVGGRRRRVRVRVRVPIPVPVLNPRTVPRTAPAPSSGPSGRDVVRGVAATGAAIGIGYLVYRGIRLIPSLFPPLWPTIPANLAIP